MSSKVVQDINFDSLSVTRVSLPGDALASNGQTVTISTKDASANDSSAAAGTANSVTISTGTGGNNAGSGNAGDAGALNITAGNGGVASGGGTGGDGGTITMTAGSGSSSNGNGGSLNLVPGDADGTGSAGTVQVNSSASWLAMTSTLSSDVVQRFVVFCVPTGVRYRVAAVTATSGAATPGRTWQAWQAPSGTTLGAVGSTAITDGGDALSTAVSVEGTLSSTASALELIGTSPPLQVGIVLSAALGANDNATFTFHLAPTV